MVDEQFPNIESSQRLNINSNMSNSSISNNNNNNSVNCIDTEMDFNDPLVQANDYLKTDNGLNSMSYEASTSSPESTSENAFHFTGKYNSTADDKNGEKKVHWNPSQVHALLDCIEKRMSDFRRKSVHKSVWLAIGKEMSDHGEFSVEHCYNKWKNLRRDIRLFSNTNSMQKLSIRNTYIMERVQKMVSEIGYEGSSRKSSSPISPNFDSIQTNENNPTQIATKEFNWAGNNYGNYEQDTRLKIDGNLCNYQIKSEKISHNNNNHINNNHNHNPNQKPAILTDQNHFHKPWINNNENIGNSVIEDSIISLLSDPTVSQAILMNPKLLEEIVPGLDLSTLMKKFSDAHPELVHAPTVIVNNSHAIDNGIVGNQFPMNGNVSIGIPLSNNSIINSHNNINNNNNPNHHHHHHKKTQINTVNSVSSHLSQNNNNDMNKSWPHQLYELLHSFRDEENRQMAILDQIVGYVQVMQESTKRRLNTINQLISLAGLLIPQK